MEPSEIGERVQCQARATPSYRGVEPRATKRPIRFAIPRPSGGLASMSMSAPVAVAPRYKPPSFSTGALCRPASVFSAISPSPRARALAFLARCTLYTSAEPCATWAGAIYWAGIGRVVYGQSEKALKEQIGAARGESDPRFALRPRIRR